MELDVVADKTADMVADKKKVAIMDWRLQGSSFVSLIETLYLLTTPTGQRYIVNSSSGKFEGKGEEEYKKFFLSYDNMCHLDSLRLFVVHWKEMPTKEFQQIYSYIIYALGITQVAPETFATAASPR